MREPTGPALDARSRPPRAGWVATGDPWPRESSIQPRTRSRGVIHDAMREHDLDNPQVVGLGGGAGALVPAVARSLNLDWQIPPDAEVISSVGDALSMVRVEIEKTLVNPDGAAIESLHRSAEEAAMKAGAAASTIQVESEAVPERGALRVVAYGSLALEVTRGRDPVDTTEQQRIATQTLGAPATLIGSTTSYAVYANDGTSRRFLVIDDSGSVVVDVAGTALTGTGAEVAAALEERVPARTRYFGPLKVAPAVRIIRGSRLDRPHTDLASRGSVTGGGHRVLSRYTKARLSPFCRAIEMAIYRPPKPRWPLAIGVGVVCLLIGIGIGLAVGQSRTRSCRGRCRSPRGPHLCGRFARGRWDRVRRVGLRWRDHETGRIRRSAWSDRLQPSSVSKCGACPRRSGPV